MKLNLTKNMDDLRTSGLFVIDVIYARKMEDALKFQFVYIAKLAEAEAILAGNDDVPTPYLSAEAALRSVSLEEIAQLVKSQAAKAGIRLSELEVERQAAKMEMRNAKTPAEIEAIKNRCNA